MSDMSTFCEVKNPNDLLPVLKSRHPKSCFMFNQVKKHESLDDRITFYTIGSEITDNSWIVSNNDFGANICISAPPAIIEGKEAIHPDVKQCFSSPTNGVIDWDNGALFVALEKVISSMIFDISVNVKGNVTEVHPDNIYYMEISEAAQIDARPSSPSIEVRRLKASQDEEMFILATWKYARLDRDIKQTIQVTPSGGVFVDGKCVSAVYTTAYGLLSALYTLKDQRRKGYGKLTMNAAFKECALDGCIPCLSVEKRNTRSIQFNEGLGVKLASVVDWIEVQKLEID